MREENQFHNVIPRGFMKWFWIVLVLPYVPSIIPGVDTQPTFTILIIILFLYALVKSNVFKAGFIKIYFLVVVSFLLSALIISLLFNVIVIKNEFQIPRLISFFQFLLAFIFGASAWFYLPDKWLKYSVIVYVVFTIIYFLSNGMLEDILIRSRDEGAEHLIASGRGARTLSPEPAIMSVHIFNLVVLHAIYFKKVDFGIKQILLISFPLIASLSGYGFFIFLALLFIFYPLPFLGLIGFGSVVLLNFLNSFDSGFRILLILNGIKEHGLEFILLDTSIRTRFFSFLGYLDSFTNNFPFGDGFTIFSGGGFISIISGLGIIGLLFFLFILVYLVLSSYSIKIKMLFLVWFVIYLFSGSTGVPLVGLILGRFMKNAFKNGESINIASSS